MCMEPDFLTLCEADEKNRTPKEQLVFLTWSEYMHPDLITEFESTYNADVKEIYYETDELKDEMVIFNKGQGYDIVLGSGESLVPYVKMNLLAPLGPKDVPNIKYIDPRWLNAYPQVVGYAVPYLWGTLGIVYRKDIVKEEVMNWKQLFQPPQHLKGRIIMINDSRDTINAALKCSGYSINSNNLEHYSEVEKLLLAQKPFVKKYSYIALTDESSLVKGTIWMAMVYNGDGLILQEKYPHISFVVPKEGTVLWSDYLMVMKSSIHKELAMKFINFLSEPQNAARLAAYLNYATPNKGAQKYLSPSHLNNPLIYPEKDILEKSEISSILPLKIIKKRNEIFSKLPVNDSD